MTPPRLNKKPTVMSVHKDGQMSSELVQVYVTTSESATISHIFTALKELTSSSVYVEIGVDLPKTPSSWEKSQPAVVKVELSSILNDNTPS